MEQNIFFENCPDYKLLTLFQGTPVDFEDNYVLWKKLNSLKEVILVFARQHLIPAEIYTRIVQRQLKLG